MVEKGILEFEGTHFLYEIKKIRFLRLKLDHEGKFKLSIPKTCPRYKVLNFLNEHKAWIESKKEYAKKLKEANSFMYFLGRKYKFTFDINLKKPRFKKGIFYARDQKNMEEFLRQNAKKIFTFYIKKYELLMDKKVQRLSIKKMRSRWGSCNHKKAYINLNLNLMQKPLKAIEYVVLHEMAHLSFPHHQKEFYEYLAQFMPDFRQRENLFKINLF
ncbi:hypothetical protein DMB92_05925 [Campylobacter sp. MIT 99-7217]|uniref:M48 family metallopeptidase n=1 Tax=Campylobacter sp. MIT 99-7217 TaxID=535091 RepID=UPI00115AAA97|nr:SprT family zinc-dependent metalloprotease [Campylobacter sp. MIT 99-7217]TQR31916.1 hypothetical protein DMB92_05925 [Campylobacter sp. MIT 99-7217]